MTRATAKSGDAIRNACVAACVVAAALFAAAAGAAAPTTGLPNPAFDNVDQTITAWMGKYSIPGGTVAIAYNGKIVYSRGYGYANATTGIRAQPDTLFRVASLSKAVTAAAILKLADSGKLNLDDKVYPYLAPDLAGAALADSRIRNITIRQMLHHTAGIDRLVSVDPPGAVFANGKSISKTCRDQIVRDLPTRVLDFDPGARFGYTNYSYCMLSRVIERVSGYTYEQFVSRNLFSPLGIATAHSGDTVSDRGGVPETYYHDKAGVGQVTPLPGIYGDPAPAQVERPYGGYYLEGYSGAGSWVISAPDYLRFVLGYRGMRQPALLSAAAQSLIYERPASPVSQADAYWYGLGLYVRSNGNGYNTWHDGWLYGTRTYEVAYSTGIAWVTMFNSTPETNYSDLSPAMTELDAAVGTALSQVAAWPTTEVVAAAPVPPQSGLWWNPAQPGRGYAIETRGGKLYLSSFLYGSDGSPVWMLSTGMMASSTSFSGSLSQFGGGQTLTGEYQAVKSEMNLGIVSIAFTSPTTATLTDASGSMAIQRFDIVPGGVAGGPAAQMPEAGLWWNPQEGGRGFFVEVQGSTLYFTGYMYGQNGQAMWYASAGPMSSPSTYQGSLVAYSGGPTLTGTYKAPSGASNVGQITLQFTDQQNAVLTLPGGNQVPLTRYRF